MGNYSFVDGEDLVIMEGVNETVVPRVRIDGVPSGGIQGVITVDITVAPQGARTCI